MPAGELSLAANTPLFPLLAEQSLSEIEPFLCFCQLLLEALDTTFKRREPRRDVGRPRFRTSGTAATQPVRYEGSNRNQWYEQEKLQIALLV